MIAAALSGLTPLGKDDLSPDFVEYISGREEEAEDLPIFTFPSRTLVQIGKGQSTG